MRYIYSRLSGRPYVLFALRSQRGCRCRQINVVLIAQCNELSELRRSASRESAQRDIDGRKMDSLGNRCSSFTPRRAFIARGFDLSSAWTPSRTPVVHVAHAQNEINHVADRMDVREWLCVKLGTLRFETVRI